MRLLNIYTLGFQEFFENEMPPYHILSHRWGRDEISYEEFCRDRIPDKAGYRKVTEFCRFIRQRRRDGLISRRRFHPFGAIAHPEQSVDMSDLAADDGVADGEERWRPPLAAGGEWVWVDTCCIDKRSSAELTEAINSMFKWYAGAYDCIVHLKDVPSWQRVGTESPYNKTQSHDVSANPNYRLYRNSEFESGFKDLLLKPILKWLRKSAWFKRGWTLQELLAPEMVVFCNETWELVGHICKTKDCGRKMYAYGVHINRIIANITSIPP